MYHPNNNKIFHNFSFFFTAAIIFVGQINGVLSAKGSQTHGVIGGESSSSSNVNAQAPKAPSGNAALYWDLVVKSSMNFEKEDFFEWRSKYELLFFDYANLMKHEQPMVVIAGQPGVAKNLLGIELAKQFNGEVIIADSTQIYKGLDLATGKIHAAQMQGIPHHMLDILAQPNASFSATQYRDGAVQEIGRVQRAGHLPLLVATSAVYTGMVMFQKQSTYWYQPNDSKFRKEARKKSPEQLYAELERIAPEVARQTNKGNVDGIEYKLQLENDKAQEKALRAQKQAEFASKTDDQLLAELAKVVPEKAKELMGKKPERDEIEAELMKEALHEREIQLKDEKLEHLRKKYPETKDLHQRWAKKNKDRPDRIDKNDRAALEKELGDSFLKRRQEYKEDKNLTNELRYKNTLVFILKPDMEKTKKEYAAKTVTKEGLKEFEDFYAKHKNASGEKIGLLQFNGYRTLVPYFEMSRAERDGPAGKQFLAEYNEKFNADQADYAQKQMIAFNSAVVDRCRDEKYGPMLVVLDASKDMQNELLPFMVEFTKYFLHTIAKKPSKSADNTNNDNVMKSNK